MATKKDTGSSYLKKASIKVGEHKDVVIAAVNIEHMDANKYGDARDADVLSFEGTPTKWVPNNTSWNILIDLLGEDEGGWLGKTIRIQRGSPDGYDLPDGLYCAVELPEQKPTNIKPVVKASTPGDVVSTPDPFA